MLAQGSPHPRDMPNVRPMDDVFAVDDPPPAGWMHAIFDDGPYSDDVGRCVPGPPPKRVLTVTDGGRSCTYHLAKRRFVA
jgi:hypothetical protein